MPNPISIELKWVARITYGAAMISGLLSMLFSLYVFLVMNVVFGWGLIYLTGFTLLIHIFYLALVIRLVTAKSWKFYIYRWPVLLFALLTIPVILVGNYLYIQLFQGF